MSVTRLNERFLMIEYPITLQEMEQSSSMLPKSERTYYQYAFNALNKIMKKSEKIYSFNPGDAKLTKTGFIVVAESQLILVSMKNSMFGGADAETIQYRDIKSVDFDIIPRPPSFLGGAAANLGVIYLEITGLFSSKKRTITNIPEENLDNVVLAIREKI